MADGGKEGAHPSLSLRHRLALRASLHHLLHPFHRTRLRVDDGPPDALGARDAFGGHVACTGLAVDVAVKPSANTKITAAVSSKLSDGSR